MIFANLLLDTLAKTAHDFKGFPRCKISKFSQDIQGICELFSSCEEISIKSFCHKSLK